MALFSFVFLNLLDSLSDAKGLLLQHNHKELLSNPTASARRSGKGKIEPFSTQSNQWGMPTATYMCINYGCLCTPTKTIKDFCSCWYQLMLLSVVSRDIMILSPFLSKVTSSHTLCSHFCELSINYTLSRIIMKWVIFVQNIFCEKVLWWQIFS